MMDIVKAMLRFRRGPWEMLATILIALGVVMLMQPFALSFSVVRGEQG